MRRVLVTGDGPVSRATAASLRGLGHEVLLWTRSSGDLRDDAPFSSAPRDVTDVVHAAALTRFTISAPDAEAVNVRGTAKAIAFARTCPGLRSFTLVSSVHAASLRMGVVEEAPLPADAEFANAYEASKARAEELVAASALPFRIARLGTLLCRDESGEPVQDNAVLVTLRLFRHGLLPLVPGLADCPVHVLTSRQAGDGLASLLDASDGVFHVTTPPALAPTLGALLASAHEALQREDARRRRIPLPLLVDHATFQLLTTGAKGLVSPLVAEALRCLAPFARQLHAPKTLLTSRAEAAAPGVLGADPLPLVGRLMERLAAGRASLTEAPA